MSATHQTFNIFDNLPGRKHQPYKSWKYNENSNNSNNLNKTYNLVAPSNNFVVNSNYSVSAYTGKPNPIKHWRKQLMPNKVIYNSKASILNAFDTPGSLNKISNKIENACDLKINKTKNYIIRNNENKNENCCHKIKRISSKKMNHNYFSNYKYYLKNRGLSFDFNYSYTEIEENEYEDENDNPIHPSNSENGSQNFSSIYCHDLSLCRKKIVIKKSTSNATNASQVTIKVRINAIEKSAASLKEFFGENARNNSRYRGQTTAPITTKNFYEKEAKDCNHRSCITSQNFNKKLAGGTGIRHNHIKIESQYKILKNLNGPKFKRDLYIQTNVHDGFNNKINPNQIDKCRTYRRRGRTFCGNCCPPRIDPEPVPEDDEFDPNDFTSIIPYSHPHKFIDFFS